MESASTYALRRADDLIRSGKPEYAQTILREYLRQNPKSEYGWLLLSLAIIDPQKQIDSLRMVLRINPNNSIARSRLAQLKMDEIHLSEATAGDAQVDHDRDNQVTPGSPLRPPQKATSPAYTEPVPRPVRPFEAIPSEINNPVQPSSPLLYKVEQVSRLSKSNPNLLVMIVGTGLVLLIVLVASITMTGVKNYQQVSVYNTQVSFQATYRAQQILPATWTFTPSPSTTPAPARPSPAPSTPILTIPSPEIAP